MTGMTGLGRRTAGGSGSPLGSSLDGLGMQVNTDNVLKVRDGLLIEADRLTTDLKNYENASMVRLCGGDPVSYEARAAFNYKIKGFYTEFRMRIQALRDAADTLEATARDYGRTEADIAGSFRSQYTTADIWGKA